MMLKRLQKLFETSAKPMAPLQRNLMISRQCDGERQDASLLRELANRSFGAAHRPAA